MKKILITLAFAFAALTGCSTTDSLKAGTGGSSFEVKGKTYDQVWRAVNKVVAGSSLAITESNKQTGTLKAEKGAGLTTWGEVVGIFVTPPNNGSQVYKIEVQSLKRSSLQLTGQDWTKTMQSGILAELDQ